MKMKMKKGFTLVELIVYMTLLTLVIGSIFTIEMTGRKATIKEYSILQMNYEAQRIIENFRLDVKAAKKIIEKSKNQIEIIMPAIDKNGKLLKNKNDKVIYFLSKKNEDKKGKTIRIKKKNESKEKTLKRIAVTMKKSRRDNSKTVLSRKVARMGFKKKGKFVSFYFILRKDLQENIVMQKIFESKVYGYNLSEK